MPNLNKGMKDVEEKKVDKLLNRKLKMNKQSKTL